MTIIFLCLFVVSLSIGVDKNLTITNLLKFDENAIRTLLMSRLPRTIAIVLTASSLSISGLIMQAISRNKFMSPSTSGTTDAATLGVILSYLIFSESSRNMQILFAFVFALLSTMLFMSVLNRIKIKETYFVPLIGMMYGSIVSAFTQVIAYQFNALQSLSTISLGSFNRFTSFDLLYIVIIPMIAAILYSTRFSIVSLGEDFSKNLGLNYNRTVFLGLVIISVISASTFVTVGPIPFVGLIVPNLITSIYGDHLKKSIIDVAILGSIFVLLCDIISRLVIYPYEIAVGLTIGIVGGFIFIFILFRKVNNG